MTNYKVCSKTIMDTTDPNIVFNENDESDYYINFQKNSQCSKAICDCSTEVRNTIENETGQKNHCLCI